MPRNEAAVQRASTPRIGGRPTTKSGEIVENLTPREIVSRLDRYIVGQEDAKRAVAVALRNRYRRQHVDPDLRNEIVPKNILMIGPTGVGKTEIAKRVARIVNAPFIKVEATRFTEVGYVGKDVESIIEDLVEVSVSNHWRQRIDGVHDLVIDRARHRLLDLLTDQSLERKRIAETAKHSGGGVQPALASRQSETRRRNREWNRFARLLDQDAIGDDVEVDLDIDGGVEETLPGAMPNGDPGEEMRQALYDVLDDMFPPRPIRRRVSVTEARRILEHEETSQLVDYDDVVEIAIQAVEAGGVVFIDEIDKTIPTDDTAGGDVSAAGVQRDLLPIIEGATVSTRFGPVRTDHILFIASGAFLGVRPSDLIPELQGRFPVRVELQSLSEQDLLSILTQPDQAIPRQYQAMLATEGVDLAFDEDALALVARLAAEINRRQDDIGARRLITILERVLEDVLFQAPDMEDTVARITSELVVERVGEIADDDDLSLYIV